jgi:hypothetical protein
MLGPMNATRSQQLSLRLDARTRRIGLEGIARVRAILAEQAQRRAAHEGAANAARHARPHRAA